MINSKNKKCIECGREDQPHFSRKRCKGCAQKDYAKKAQEKREEGFTMSSSSPPKKKTASKTVKNNYISPISKKQAERLKEYRKLRDEYMKVHETCETRDCSSPATEVHHSAGRIGDLLTDTNYFLAVCRRCHRYIEEHPQWAKDNGYSFNRL